MNDFTREELDSIQHAARLILAAKNVVVLTGAGFSTPSGIPDFRSAGSGLWTRYLPMEVASLSTFRHEPEKFFAWLRPLASHMWSAEPNQAHLALVELEKAGHLQAIITQNIDGLHTRSGSQHVLEVHGTLNTLTCTACFNQYPAGGFIDRFLQEGVLPYCPEDQRLLKPDVILFEEQLPYKIWKQAEKAAESCDLMLVAGTSLEVMPSAGLPLKVLEHGGRLILVNRTATYIDVRANLIIKDDVARAIPHIVAEVIHANRNQKNIT